MAPDARHLDKRVRIVWLFPTILAITLIWLLGSTAYLMAPPDSGVFGIPKPLFLVVFAVLLLLFVGLPIYLWIQLTYNNFTYELSEKDIIVREGVFTRKTTVIPYSKIQDITSERTFVERMLGIATLELETAGSSRIASETKIPGIANKDEVIREIMAMVESSKESGADKTGKDGKPSIDSVMGEVLKELKTITSKLDALGSAKGASEHKEQRKEKPELFEPLEHDDGFRRFRKK